MPIGRTLGLSREGGWTLASINGAIGSGGAEEAFSGAHNGGGELGIVRTALYHRLPLDEGLVFPIEIEPHLDRDRAAYAEPSFVYRRMYKITYFSSRIRVQPKGPFHAIGPLGVGFCRPETPVCKPNIRHVRGEKAR